MLENESHNPEQTEGAENAYPPKPQIIEKKQNAVTRSLLSLFIYALLFYMFFNNNLAYVAGILLVLVVHEMGHFLAMRYFRYSNVRIFIVPLLGAFTSGKKQEVSQRQLSIIILAGPVPGIAIGTFLYYLNLQWQNETVGMLAYAFLAINLLNCLPFHPLDGGRLIETLFFKENYLIHLVFGIISIMGLVLLFIILFLSGSGAGGLLLLLIPLLIGMELYNESKHHKIREYLSQEKINYRTDYAALPDKDYWLIRDCLIFSFPKKYSGITPGRYEYSMLEGAIVQQINAVLQTSLIPDLRGIRRLLVLFFYLFVFVAPVAYLIATRNMGA